MVSTLLFGAALALRLPSPLPRDCGATLELLPRACLAGALAGARPRREFARAGGADDALDVAENGAAAGDGRGGGSKIGRGGEHDVRGDDGRLGVSARQDGRVRV